MLRGVATHPRERRASGRFGQVLRQHQRIAIGIIEGRCTDHAFDRLGRTIKADLFGLKRGAGGCDILDPEDRDEVAGGRFCLFAKTKHNAGGQGLQFAPP